MEFTTSFAIAIVVAVCAAAAVYFVLRSRIDGISRRTAALHKALVMYAQDVAQTDQGTEQVRGEQVPDPGGSAPPLPHVSESEYETETDDDQPEAYSSQEVRTVTLGDDSAACAAWPPSTNQIIVVADGPLGERAIVSDDDEAGMEVLPSDAEHDGESEAEFEVESLPQSPVVEGSDDAGVAGATRQQYEAMTKAELKRLVTDGGLASNPSKLRKPELVDALVGAAETRS